MKQKLRGLLPVLLALCLLLQSCLQLDTDVGDTPDPPDRPSDDRIHYYENATYVYLSDPEEGVLTTGLSAYYLFLANKVYSMDRDYAPDSLKALDVTITHYGEYQELETRTAEALVLMCAEMREAGIGDVFVTSAYRDYQRQRSLYNTYISRECSEISAMAWKVLGAEYVQTYYIDEGKRGLDPADAERVVLSYSAAPGTSEHQTGLCVDFITSDMTSLTEAFDQTEAFAWLRDNAYKFGFILRYPKGKEGVTGYTYEPWHYRFVGREAATDIYFGNLTLEEYLGVA